MGLNVSRWFVSCQYGRGWKDTAAVHWCKTEGGFVRQRSSQAGRMKQIELYTEAEGVAGWTVTFSGIGKRVRPIWQDVSYDAGMRLICNRRMRGCSWVKYRMLYSRAVYGQCLSTSVAFLSSVSVSTLGWGSLWKALSAWRQTDAKIKKANTGRKETCTVAIYLLYSSLYNRITVTRPQHFRANKFYSTDNVA